MSEKLTSELANMCDCGDPDCLTLILRLGKSEHSISRRDCHDPDILRRLHQIVQSHEGLVFKTNELLNGIKRYEDGDPTMPWSSIRGALSEFAAALASAAKGESETSQSIGYQICYECNPIHSYSGLECPLKVERKHRQAKGGGE